MNELHLQKWYPRHWLMPLGVMGMSIMMVFVLNVFVPHKGAFLPAMDQVWQQVAAGAGLMPVVIAGAAVLFWVLYLVGTLLLVWFIYKSVQFLRAGAHQMSDRNVMETAGWFGMPLSLAMFGNVSGFAVIMLLGLDSAADDILWPFWLVYDVAIALMALFQLAWYRALRKQADNPEHYSMVVPFAIGFMGLNLAGPGALSAEVTVSAVSMLASMLFIALSVALVWEKRAAIGSGLKALAWAIKGGQVRLAERQEQVRQWGHMMNLATAVTTFNVWQITTIRNYLNYSEQMGNFDLALKNSLTWGLVLTWPLLLLVLWAFWRSGFMAHLFDRSRKLIFTLGLICMLVSTYVLTALFTMTAAKLGWFAKYDLTWNTLWGLEAMLVGLTLATVSILVFRMLLKGNMRCWQMHEVQSQLPPR
ncbi:TsoY family (seleno)protein [Thiomicrorhabdus cannonii]|uniref:TsoY family (seleno)protein n=1 Tax=Thiomicrorhabdus cannonii TaxID=2748011 RepID=UPI0015BEF372|nr:hypothetical protein [Thiomicrorhabdus cannonii]